MPASLEEIIAILRFQEADDERLLAKLHDSPKTKSLRLPPCWDKLNAYWKIARHQPFPGRTQRSDENGAVLKTKNVWWSNRPKVRDKWVFQQQFLQPQHSQHAWYVDLRNDESYGQPLVWFETSWCLPPQPYDWERQIWYTNCSEEYSGFCQWIQI